MTQTIECASACVVTVVHEFNLPFFALDLQDAAQISLAIISLWAVAYGIRMLIKTLKSEDSDQ